MNETMTGLVRQRQDPLRQRYLEAPGEAGLSDCARAESAGSDVFHGSVYPGEGSAPRWNFGIHRAIGGYHDLPNPGDILAAALSACLDSTLRMVAERLGVKLDALEVGVSAFADARGCLLVDRNVPAGFLRMEVDVRMQAAEGTPPAQVEALAKTAEQCCVVLQTLRNGVAVHAKFHGGSRVASGEAAPA